MALTSPLVTWLLANAGRLNLQVSRFDWVDDWLPGFYDFAVELTVDGHLYEGRGTAQSEDLAFAKAGAEALERIAMHSTKARSSNGFAVHTTFAEAAEFATAELLERDAYFWHWLTQTPFVELDGVILSSARISGAKLPEVVDRLAAGGITMTHARLSAANGAVAVICISRGTQATRPFGWVQGLGCSNSLEGAVAKATIECLRTVVAWEQGTYRGGAPLTAAEFAAIPHPGALEHERLGLHPQWTGFNKLAGASESLAEKGNGRRIFKNRPTAAGNSA